MSAARFSPNADWLRRLEREGTPRAHLQVLYRDDVWPAEWITADPNQLELVPKEDTDDDDDNAVSES